MNQPQINTLTVTRVYVDDNPTGTSSDTYTITATITDDDTGTDSTTASITVNNVAPTVAINSITAIDKVLAVDADGNATDWLNPGQLDESEGFVVRGTVTDPGVNDTHTATLKVDLNFDGDTDDAGESVAVAVTPVPNTPGHWPSLQISYRTYELVDSFIYLPMDAFHPPSAPTPQRRIRTSPTTSVP